MKLSELVDLSELHAELEAGTIYRNVSPDGELSILNYGNRATYANVWTPTQRACRGLVVAGDGTVVARPFDKFFGVNERPETRISALPPGPITVTDKLDGALGVVYWHNDEPYVTSRGRLDSTISTWATAWLREHVSPTKLRAWTGGVLTLLVEVISPRSQVVVDYAGRDELILLAARDIESGAYLSMEMLDHIGDALGLRVTPHRTIASLDELLAQRETRTGIEGWVLIYPGGLRVKLKTAEYLRLHRLVMTCTVKHIREVLEADGGAAISGYAQKLPPHLRTEVLRVASELLHRRLAVLTEAQRWFARTREFIHGVAPQLVHDRRMFARMVEEQQRPDFAVLYQLWDMAENRQRVRVDPEQRLAKLCWDLVDHRDLALDITVEEEV